MKLEGLDSVKNVIKAWNHHHLFTWDLITVSKETANKFLAGEFKKLREVLNFEDNLEFSNNENISLLYREVFDENRKSLTHIIETIFINE